MTTVAQMIEWLSKLPQDAEVHCMVEKPRGYGYEASVEMEPIDISECQLYDFRDQVSRESYPHLAGKIIVQIRGE